MILFSQLIKITGHIFFVITIIFFSTLHAKNIDKFNKANNIANYFSGILLLNESKYAESYEFLKKLDGLEQSHSSYSSKYLYSHGTSSGTSELEMMCFFNSEKEILLSTDIEPDRTQSGSD